MEGIYYYNPPELTDEGTPFPPLVFESNGTEKVVMSPHLYWHRISQKYLIEKVWDSVKKEYEIDTKTGKPREIYGYRSAWVLDEEQNKRLKAGEIGKPDNSIAMSKIDLSLVKQPRYAPMNRYLVSQDSVFKKERRSLEELKKQHLEEFENERKLIEQERDELKRVREKTRNERLKIEAELAAVEQDKRKSLGR